MDGDTRFGENMSKVLLPLRWLLLSFLLMSTASVRAHEFSDSFNGSLWQNSCMLTTSDSARLRSMKAEIRFSS